MNARPRAGASEDLHRLSGLQWTVRDCGELRADLIEEVFSVLQRAVSVGDLDAEVLECVLRAGTGLGRLECCLRHLLQSLRHGVNGDAFSGCDVTKEEEILYGDAGCFVQFVEPGRCLTRVKRNSESRRARCDAY